MPKKQYSKELCRNLTEQIESAELAVPYRPVRYEDGDELTVSFTTVWPEISGKARFKILKFVGGGFAGQVYRCVLESLKLPVDTENTGLHEGSVYAVKIMIPASGFSRWFRDKLYWIAFQTPFSAQINKGACRSGLLWQRFSKLGAEAEFGRKDAVADVYASFYDPVIQSYGEIREWVEGRTWRLESDTAFKQRRHWKNIDPNITDSPEYVAKHQFMYRFVKVLHGMGARELARQYEWWTMKSQPNALRREGAGNDARDGLCAVDFRAGLALIPVLPMSIGDIGLIISGLRHGSISQFDRCDFTKLREYAEGHKDVFGNCESAIAHTEKYDTEYRRSMPDITHQGHRLILDSSLRKDVRKGLTSGYLAADLIDKEFAELLPQNPLKFSLFYFMGAVPVLGKFIRRIWGNRLFRSHLRQISTSKSYHWKNELAVVRTRLIEWHRSGRCSEKRVRFLANHPVIFWFLRCTVGIIPFPGLHRAISEPSFAWGRIRDGVKFMRTFYKDSDFREQWLKNEIEEGFKDGMLHEEERDAILKKIKDPFIAKYLKCVAVHFATLPVTQIVSVIVGGVVAARILLSGGSKEKAGLAFGGVVILFQFIPISPGSICRGLYVVYLMIKERNFKDYMVAAPLSFVKYIGYLAFPIQMTTTYPALAQLMAGRWATEAVHIIPVFGEKGALLEHMLFDLFFNVPRKFGNWASKRIAGILEIWLALGLGILFTAFSFSDMKWSDKSGINLILAVTAVFVLPRILFYPVMKKRKEKKNNR